MRQSSRLVSPRAFTLVELLVVIGIIALLISILLPALNAARRQANTTKCLTQLREIGNCFNYYAIDYKGAYPPAQLIRKAGVPLTYSLHGVDYNYDAPEMNGYGVYWFNFLQKYVSKSKIGGAETSANDTGYTRTKSVFWGCPNWQGYQNDAFTGGTNRLQPGYGMNAFPTFTNTYPAAKKASGPIAVPTAAPARPDAKEWAYNAVDPVTNVSYLWAETENHNIGFTKQKQWGRNGAERCLVADSRFWLADSGQLTTAVIPPQNREANENGAANETSIFMWRHGKTPSSMVTTNKYAVTGSGGKIAYNILYCDGHVATATDPAEAYKSIRMKFPG